MTIDPSATPRPGEHFQPAQAAPARYCLLATFAGLVLPAAAAIAVLGWVRSGTIRATGAPADVLVGLLAVIAAVAVALLAQAAWRRLSLPQPGLGEFLPHRWIQRREAVLKSQDLLAELGDLPAGASPRAAELLAELATALAATDPYQRGRPQRRAQLCAELAQELALPEGQRRQLQLAAQLEDIGLAEVPSEILDQAGPLEDGQGDLIRRHPAIGAALIAPWVEPEVAAAVYSHHEHLDGGGYPQGLGGPEIPMLAVLLAVVDTYDALISDRPQRRGFSGAEATEELQRMAGYWLAETPVAALLAVVESRASGWAGMGPTLSRFRHAIRGSAAPLTAAVAVILVGLAAWAGDLSPAPASVTAVAPPQASPATPPSPAAPLSPSAANPTSPTPTPPTAATGPASTPSPAAGQSPASATAAKTLTKSTTSNSQSTASGGSTPQQSPATNGSSQNNLSVPGPMTIQVPPDAGASPNPAPSPSPTQAPPPSPNPAPVPSPSPAIVRPVVDLTTPLAGPAGGGTTVTINGSGFTGATSVTFGGTAADFVVNSSTVITAVSPAGKGIVLIKVTTPAGTSTSLLALFTYTGAGLL